MDIASTRARTSWGSWLVPLGLILLALIPIVSGALRLTQLGGGPQVVPAAARFTDSPVPVVLHIVSATLFSVFGAFQFVPVLRRGRRSWHTVAGRVLLPAGFVLALSGLWMATVYPHPAGDGPALLVIRVVFGSYMLLSLVLAVRALMRRRYSVHGAWMTRAYALGVAAGTQAIALIPGSILFGSDDRISRAVAIGAAWVLNLAVAELVIRRRSIRGARASARTVVVRMPLDPTTIEGTR
ncbi:DUF2306 domain-containing protein [Amnibacterium sp.]|uniref:DUF2306 domain-containing protein n=1 Tax=Amnibacterium sp. TaxID=1872496 RepID=UPI00260ED2F1|nr:DUF2306 domain-containing protein [Amnibacterium sp.]MCU1473687.1 rane protein [Amnibacterium sp.]